MPNRSLQYRAKFQANQRLFYKQYLEAFKRVGDKVSKLVNNPDAKFISSVSYARAPRLKKAIGNIIGRFNNDTFELSLHHIELSAELSSAKNTLIFSDYLKRFNGTKNKRLGTAPNRQQIIDYIKNVKRDLSDSVWQTSTMLRSEMEVHLAIGIIQGTSANVLSQRIRQYLNNPDALFRRVRDEDGNLILSKSAREYHPGQGVYRSAYKNAMRVARSETNRAYLTADCERWSKSKLVLGIRIELSESHPDYNFPEICELLEGDYPVDFMFPGWHPQCLCHAVPILPEEEDFRAYLRGKGDLKGNKITEYPAEFKNFVAQNQERIMDSNPYWYDENKSVIDKIIQEQPQTPAQGNKPVDLLQTDFMKNEKVIELVNKDFGRLPYEDPVLKEICKMNNLTDTPTILSKEAFDTAQGLMAFRGLGTASGETYCKQFMTGEYFAGEGIYGNGTYMAVVKEGYSEYDALATAKSYTGYEGKILQIKIPEGLTVKKVAEVENEMFKWQEEFRLQINDDVFFMKKAGATEAEVDKYKETAKKLTSLLDDPGRFAAFRGYDGMIKSLSGGGQDYAVWINRKGLLVSKDLINPLTD